MTTGHPVFGGPPKRFGEAYPDVERIRIRWVQDRTHTLDALKGEPEGTFWYGPEGGHISDHIPCANTFCKQGRIDWMRFFDEMRLERETERKDERIRCRGTEGHGKKCLNHAMVSIEITYRAKDEGAEA